MDPHGRLSFVIAATEPYEQRVSHMSSPFFLFSVFKTNTMPNERLGTDVSRCCMRRAALSGYKDSVEDEQRRKDAGKNVFTEFCLEKQKQKEVK